MMSGLGMDINKLQLKRLLLISIIIIGASIPAVYAGVTFDIERKNLSLNNGDEQTPEITAAGNSVYVVWFNDTSNKLQFTNSTDSGTTFGSAIDLGTLTTSSVDSNPKIVVKEGSPNKIFVVWVDGTNIKIINSTDNGDTFNAEIDIGDTGGATGGFPKIANSTSDKVYVTWVEEVDAFTAKVQFINSTSDGQFGSSDADFDVDIDIDNRNFPAPAIAASGSNVYLLWASDDDFGNTPRIKFRNSTDSGDSFGSTMVVDAHGGIIAGIGKHANPALAVNGTKVYLAWLLDTANSATTKIRT